jgi:hypothetical protein
MEVRYAFDAVDSMELVGFASNVFVGQVVEKTGPEGAPLSGTVGEPCRERSSLSRC